MIGELIMSYTPTEWATGDVAIEEKLNKREQGITDNEVDIADLSAMVPDPPSDKGIYTLTATVSNGTPTYSWEGLKLVSWETGTDEEIVAMIQAAHDGLIDLHEDAGWEEYDGRPITVSAFTAGGNVPVAEFRCTLLISSFAEYEGCGNVMQVDFYSCPVEKLKMNQTSDTTGGYGACEMYADTLPAMAEALPQYLKDMLITFDVQQGGNVITGNKLALRSRTEVFGEGDDGEQLPFYDGQGGTKYNWGSSTALSWWLRSVEDSTNFYYVTSSVALSSAGASSTLACAPFFCL